MTLPIYGEEQHFVRQPGCFVYGGVATAVLLSLPIASTYPCAGPTPEASLQRALKRSLLPLSSPSPPS